MRNDGVRTFRNSETRDYKLSDKSAIKSSEREERQRLRAGEIMTSRDNAKLFNDDNKLELFMDVVKLVELIHRSQCITALRRKASAVELSHVHEQEIS